MLVVKEKWAEARKQKISTRWEYNFEGQDFLFFFFLPVDLSKTKLFFWWISVKVQKEQVPVYSNTAFSLSTQSTKMLSS